MFWGPWVLSVCMQRQQPAASRPIFPYADRQSALITSCALLAANRRFDRAAGTVAIVCGRHGWLCICAAAVQQWPVHTACQAWHALGGLQNSRHPTLKTVEWRRHCTWNVTAHG